MTDPGAAEFQPRSDHIYEPKGSALFFCALIALSAFAFGILIATPDPVQIRNQNLTPSDVLPACATEDSSNCYWDASTRGNREGRSFIDIGGVIYYTDYKGPLNP